MPREEPCQKSVIYQKLGTYDSKGVMVRRTVTEVVRYLDIRLRFFEYRLNGFVVNPFKRKRKKKIQKILKNKLEDGENIF